MLQLNDKKNCCGCTACYTICPKSAIQMKKDEEGFFLSSNFFRTMC